MKASGGLVIVLSGPAGSGKDTVLDCYFNTYSNAVAKTVSATTRQPRPGEEHGRDYFFYSREEFLEVIEQGRLVEHVEYAGNFYGTLVSEVERVSGAGGDVILKIDVEGGLRIREKFQNAVLVFLMPPSMRELKRRLYSRGTEEPAVIRKRLLKATEEMKIGREQYDYVIINDKIETAAQKLDEIITSLHGEKQL